MTLGYYRVSRHSEQVMQAAILIVLIVIAVILAPWLLAIVAAGVAAFGVILMAALGVAVACALGVAIWALAKGVTRQKDAEAPPIVGARKVCRSCQAEMPAGDIICPNCKARN